jgi:hypothetical protein
MVIGGWWIENEKWRPIGGFDNSPVTFLEAVLALQDLCRVPREIYAPDRRFFLIRGA